MWEFSQFDPILPLVRICVFLLNVVLYVSLNLFSDIMFLVDTTLWSLMRFIWQRDIVSSYFDNGKLLDEQGIEDAFELLYEINERVRTGLWVGDCFIYNNSSRRLNYCVGGEVWVSSCRSTCFMFFRECEYFVDEFDFSGHHHVSPGQAYVFVGLYCKSKSCISYW